METRTSSAALAMLPLPDLALLSEPQRRGAVCVWDGATLGPDATDLGQRQAEDGRTVFPRACHTCTRAHIRGTAATHTATCEHCVTAAASFDEATTCDTAQTLHHLVRTYAR